MAKFRVPSWLQPSSSSAAASNPHGKKRNRRSLSGLARLPSKGADPAVEAAPVAKGAGSPAQVAPTMVRGAHSPLEPAPTAKGGSPLEPAPAVKADDMSALSPAAARSDFRFVQLARKIVAEAEKLEAYLKDNGLPEPGFDVDAPQDFPCLSRDAQQCRQEIVFASRELESLARGPKESLRWGVWSYLDILSLQIINSYDIANLVPLAAPIPLAELATKTTLDPVNLARVLRYAMTNHVFCEPEPGLVAHTAASKALAQDTSLQDWVGFNADDVLPAAGKVLEALRKHPEATSLTTTGFNYAFGTVGKEPMFVTFGRDLARAKRMGGAMSSLTGTVGYELRHLVDACDLSAVDERRGTLVDVGGSHGFVCVALAERWKGIEFVVQDLPKTVQSAPVPISSDASVAARITFQPHDFFTEQPVKGADVYFFRWIFHNYSTPYAVKLLRNLVPALAPGARIVICDHCLREPGSEQPWDEKLMRGMDMVMLSLLNAQERCEGEFRALFAEADDGFVFRGVTRPDGCRMSIIEAVWAPGGEAPGV